MPSDSAFCPLACPRRDSGTGNDTAVCDAERSDTGSLRTRRSAGAGAASAGLLETVPSAGSRRAFDLETSRLAASALIVRVDSAAGLEAGCWAANRARRGSPEPHRPRLRSRRLLIQSAGLVRQRNFPGCRKRLGNRRGFRRKSEDGRRRRWRRGRRRLSRATEGRWRCSGGRGAARLPAPVTVASPATATSWSRSAVAVSAITVTGCRCRHTSASPQPRFRRRQPHR